MAKAGDPNEVPEPPVKLLQPGECVRHKTYGVRPDIFPKYSIYRQENERRSEELAKNNDTTHEGIITKSVAGDIFVGIAAGFLLAEIKEQLWRK